MELFCTGVKPLLGSSWHIARYLIEAKTTFSRKIRQIVFREIQREKWVRHRVKELKDMQFSHSIQI